MSSSKRPARTDRDGPTRRQALILGGGALALTSGCGLRFETDPLPPAPPAPPTIDELARERAAALAAGLLAFVSAVRRTRPDAARALDAMAADHRAHLAALRPASTTPAPPVLSTPVPPTVLALVRAEQAAARSALADVTPTGATTARLLASVAASLQVHVSLLTAVPEKAR